MSTQTATKEYTATVPTQTEALRIAHEIARAIDPDVRILWGTGYPSDNPHDLTMVVRQNVVTLYRDAWLTRDWVTHARITFESFR